MKRAKVLQFCKLLKFRSIWIFLQFIKTAKLLQFRKNKLFLSIGNLAIYKNVQIIEIVQLIKITLYICFYIFYRQFLSARKYKISYFIACWPF
jgi:hypothetical protein